MMIFVHKPISLIQSCMYVNWNRCLQSCFDDLITLSNSSFREPAIICLLYHSTYLHLIVIIILDTIVYL